MNATELADWLETVGAGKNLGGLSEDLINELPHGVNLDSDAWDVISWQTRIGNSRTCNIHFKDIQHPELKRIAKIWVLEGRLNHRIKAQAGKLRVGAIQALSEVLGSRSISTLKTDDFFNAERWVFSNFGESTATRKANMLRTASSWLSTHLTLPLDYQGKKGPVAPHGRFGNEQGRSKKLISTEVLREMVGALHREDLSEKDRFFLKVLAANIGAGFRISEMALLPADCLIREGGVLQLRVFAGKGGKPIARPIDPLIADVVEDAIRWLQSSTERGRSIARQQRKNPPLPWREITQDPVAFRYFVGCWANEWTARPENQLINPDGAWYKRDQRLVDAIGAVEQAGGNKSQAARDLGLHRPTLDGLLKAQWAGRRGELPPVSSGGKRNSWDTDERVISFLRLEKHCGLTLHQKTRKIVRDIVEKAYRMQLNGQVYPAPERNEVLEERFEENVPPLITDEARGAVLHPEDALLVTEKYRFASAKTRVDEFRVLSDSDISNWLSGMKRSHGAGNQEDSVFRRLGVVDPETGGVASFTWHEVRHWLDTMYENGGFTQDQLALIFNRQNETQNAVYDQTSKKTRADRMREGVRQNMMVGVVQETFNVLLAEESREEAEAYLEAATRQANPMPHGHCTLDWATVPCPHHLSCFKHEEATEGPCEHLIVDKGDPEQMEEIRRLNRTSVHQENMLREQLEMAGVETSPQLEHTEAIRRNTAKFLNPEEESVEGAGGNG